MTNSQFIQNAGNRTYTAISILREIDSEKLNAILPGADINQAIENLKAFDQLLCNYSNGVLK